MKSNKYYRDIALSVNDANNNFINNAHNTHTNYYASDRNVTLINAARLSYLAKGGATNSLAALSNNINEATNAASTYFYQSPTAAAAAASTTVLVSDEHKHKTRSDVSSCLVMLATVGLFLSLVVTILTHVFPFWLELQIPANGQSTLNVTSVIKNIALGAHDASWSLPNNSNAMLRIQLGLWEIRSNAPFELSDASGNLAAAAAAAMNVSTLWLSGSGDDTFTEYMLKFLYLNVGNLFLVQLLQVIHIIFTLLAAVCTAFILCLRTVCMRWYLISLFMACVSFACGLATILLVVVWLVLPIPVLYDEHAQSVAPIGKALGWTFWASVGVNSAIMIAICLIALHTLIAATIMCCRKRRRNKTAREARKAAAAPDINGLNNNVYFDDIGGGASGSGDVVSNRSFNDQHIQLTQQTQLHQHQQQSVSRPHSADSSGLRLQQQQHVLPFQLNQSGSSGQPANATSQSYLFYTGYGNYQKHQIADDDVDTSPRRHQQQQQQQQQSNSQLDRTYASTTNDQATTAATAAATATGAAMPYASVAASSASKNMTNTNNEPTSGRQNDYRLNSFIK